MGATACGVVVAHPPPPKPGQLHRASGNPQRKHQVTASLKKCPQHARNHNENQFHSPGLVRAAGLPRVHCG